MMKLSQLVSSALEDAQAKVASAKDAEKVAGLGTSVGKAITDRGHMPVNLAALGERLGGKTVDSQVGRGALAAAGVLGTGALAAGAGAKKLLSKKEPEKTSALDTAVEAMKLAESLEHLAMLFPKLAEASAQINDINGPEVMVSPNMGVTKDSPTKATSVPAHRASSGGGSGPNMAIETNKHPDAGEQNYAAKAAQAILEAKIAQSNALLMAGQAQAASQLAKQAQAEFEAAAKQASFAPPSTYENRLFNEQYDRRKRQERMGEEVRGLAGKAMEKLRGKQAYEEEDASTNTPKGNPQSLAVNRRPGDLPVPSGPVTDNAGMIAMTKRQAKTEDVRREAGKHVQETALSAASDKGLIDNLDHTEGAKIAGIFYKAASRKAAGAARGLPFRTTQR